MDATVSDWNGSIRNDHSKLPKNLICCNHHFIFLGLKKTFLTKYVFRCNEFGNLDTEKAPWNGKKKIHFDTLKACRSFSRPTGCD